MNDETPLPTGLLGEREMRAVRAGLRTWQLLSSDAGTALELVEMAGGETRLTWDEIEHLAVSVERGEVHLLHMPPPPPRGTRCACGALAEEHAYAVGVGWVCAWFDTFRSEDAATGPEGAPRIGPWARDLARAYAAGADGPFVGVQGLARELRAVLRIGLGTARRAAWRLMEDCGALPPPPEGCCHGTPVDFRVLQSWRCPVHPRSPLESELHPDGTRAAAGDHVYICWGYRSPGNAGPGEIS